jgi:hypothetical protein
MFTGLLPYISSQCFWPDVEFSITQSSTSPIQFACDGSGQEKERKVGDPFIQLRKFHKMILVPYSTPTGVLLKASFLGNAACLQCFLISLNIHSTVTLDLLIALLNAACAGVLTVLSNPTMRYLRGS